MNNLLSKFFSKQDWILGMKFSPLWCTTLKVPQTSTSTKKSWKLCSGKRKPRCWPPLGVIRSLRSPHHFLYAKPQTHRRSPSQVLVLSLSLPNVNRNQLLQHPPVRPRRFLQVMRELKQKKCVWELMWNDIPKNVYFYEYFLVCILFCCFQSVGILILCACIKWLNAIITEGSIIYINWSLIGRHDNYL